MSSNFSNDSGVASDSIFKKHHVRDLVGSLAESKLLADGYSNVHKWQHRAKVLLVGDPALRPYDPIYLDGLPNGMSGYWIVLSIIHRFGGSPANYVVEVEVGTDILGDQNPSAAYAGGTRDVQAEIAGQALIEDETIMIDVSTSPNSSSFTPSTGVVPPTAATKSSDVAVPTVSGSTPYLGSAPNTSNVKPVTRFRAKKNGTLVI